MPQSVHNALLPNSGVTNQPTIPSGNLSVIDLTVNAGRTLDLTGGSLTVTGVLTMNGGNITVTGANLLTIGGGGSINRTTGSILGSIEKIYTSTGAFTYPVGTPTGHSPVAVNITALTTNPSNLRVSANDGTIPAIPPINDATTLDRYWTLTETGELTANVVFNYLLADVDGVETNYRTIRTFLTAANALPNGSPCPGAGSPCVDAGAHTITVNGIYTFSNWTAGEVAPVAANVSVSGRVLDAEGRAVSNAQISMIDGAGNIRLARTSPFGYFRFEEVEAGANYTFIIQHKRYEFTPQILTINEDVSEIIFVALTEE